MDFSAFKKFYIEAPTFVALYHSREALVRAQCMQLEREKEVNNVLAIDIVSKWITQNTTWLVDNEEMYDKCISVLSLPRYDVTTMFEVYGSIYGTTEV